MNTITKSEQRVVDYILTNPYSFLSQNINQICDTCQVSRASIYRLCQKLELSGFSDLKLEVSKNIESYLKEHDVLKFNFPFHKEEVSEQIIQKISNDYLQTSAATQNLMDTRMLERSAKLLKNAQNITLYSTAGNVFFAENFQFQMQEIGIKVHVPIDDYQQRLSAAASSKQDVAILISFGGGGSVQQLIQLFKHNHTPIICITSAQKHNPIKDISKYVLYMTAQESHYRKISSFSTRLSLLYILDCLFASYFQLDYDNNIHKKLHYYKLLSNQQTI
ncbi:MurR/RpiR family transcriptional regulator [Culicoidibacter larvae]|nr:MurR/RpiR family transcriptional regulator [Culicoidibacter larvae]